MEVWYNALLVEKKIIVFLRHHNTKEKEENIKALQPGWRPRSGV